MSWGEPLADFIKGLYWLIGGLAAVVLTLLVVLIVVLVK